MNDTQPPDRRRCATVWLAATVLAAGATAWLAPDLAAARAARGHLGDEPFDRLLVWLLALLALLCVAWLWEVTTLVTLDAARGTGRTGPGGVPQTLRRLLLVACGVVLVGGLSTPALATPGQAHRGHVPLAALDGLPLPDRPTGGLLPREPSGSPVAPTARPVAAPRTGGTVVVRPGDSLWGLSADQLPRDADTAHVAAYCRRLYALNRDAIGTDPDVIHPGLRLRLPHR